MTDPQVLTSPSRLSALRELEILDTAQEAVYDDLATLAAAIFRGPVGVLNFVDARRHFSKAIVGATGEQGASVPSEISFCAATVQSDDGLLLIPDTHAEDRWRDHQLVTGDPRVRFYAGASILSRGERVGVVCAFGDERHDISDCEQAALLALARQAEAQLELRLRNMRLRDLALTDSLTGLANRRRLFDELKLALDHRRRKGGHLGVLFCDLDGFKAINDQYGHDTGDELLCQLADRLREMTRDSDVVSRIAGDEFVIVCPGLSQAEALDEVAARLSSLHLDAPASGAPSPTVSVGAVLAGHGETASEVLRRADQAMYRHKRARRRSARRALNGSPQDRSVPAPAPLASR